MIAYFLSLRSDFKTLGTNLFFTWLLIVVVENRASFRRFIDNTRLLVDYVRSNHHREEKLTANDISEVIEAIMKAIKQKKECFVVTAAGDIENEDSEKKYKIQFHSSTDSSSVSEQIFSAASSEEASGLRKRR